MRVVSDLAELQRGRPAILTIGAFDGVHRGHQWVIRQVVERARRLDYDSLVMTFDPAPPVVLRPGSVQITDRLEKTRVMAALDPSVLAVIPFSREVAQIPAGQFLASILDHVNLEEVWVGADFAFGHNREGTVDFLIRSGQQNSFAVHVLPRQGIEGVAISSTRIRELVEQGNMEQAAVLLGHYMSVSGPVVAGFGRGSALGYPTANVRPAPSQLLPAIGVYAAYLRHDGHRLAAAVSVGYNVVFGGQDISVEAYVLDFAGDLRDQTVGLDFVTRVSDEQHFDTVEDLKAKIGDDVERVRHILDSAREPGELNL